MDSHGVEIYPVCQACPANVDDDHFASQIASWLTGSLRLGDNGTHFGFVESGDAIIECASGRFELSEGMYFSIPEAVSIEGSGAGFVATRVGWKGFFQLGGPTESEGRLRYIDGCSDSLLLSPVTLGDPCLNLLYLPPDTKQTCHTHPSCRLGMIISGKGICRTPEKVIQLERGQVFSIAPEALHSFHTKDECLRVIAWHPDSDFGPAHHDHPMINRTIIDGKSASVRNLPASNEKQPQKPLKRV